MKALYTTEGTTALKVIEPVRTGSLVRLDVLRSSYAAAARHVMDEHPWSATCERTEVDDMLDDFDGADLAVSKGDKLFCGIALAVVAVVVFVVSFVIL